MPRPDHITIHVTDLKNILDQLEAKKIPSMPVQIIDVGNYYSIRDTNDMLIAKIQKLNWHAKPIF